MGEEKSRTAVWTKGLACVCGLVLIGLCAYSFATLATFNPINIILPVYYLYRLDSIFGVFIIASEFEITCILKNFKMIESFFGRGIFYFL